MPNVTLKELAEKLNVSVSTVSKALNDSHEIGEHTKSRVKELAKLYNYVPNKIALSLKNNQTKTIGVIIPDILNPFYAKVLHGIEREAAKHGFQIITCISNELLKKEQESLQLLANGSVDGIILAIAKETQLKNEFLHFQETLNKKIPIVMFDRVTKHINADKVIINDYQAIHNATKALLNQGKIKVAFISAISQLSVGELRERGYREAINGTPIILNIEDASKSKNLILEFLNNHDIDGVVAADNITGVITINVATSLGYRIPENIAVIGFADETIASYALPKLSRIHQNEELMGEKSCELLIQRLHSNDDDVKVQTITIETPIIEAESFVF